MIEDREMEDLVWELCRQGRGYSWIAGELGISERDVEGLASRATDRALEEADWRAPDAPEAQRAWQVQQLTHLYFEYLAGWRRSGEVAATVARTSGRVELNKAGEVVELPDLVVLQRREGAGDPVFLQRAADALKTIREVLGHEGQAAAGASRHESGLPLKAYVCFDTEQV